MNTTRSPGPSGPRLAWDAAGLGVRDELADKGEHTDATTEREPCGLDDGEVEDAGVSTDIEEWGAALRDAEGFEREAAELEVREVAASGEGRKAAEEADDAGAASACGS